jgi:hypothetical protein
VGLGRRRLAALGPRSAAARPFWTLVAIRAAVWAGAALALLWAPAPVAGGNPDFRAYEALTDLLFGAFATWDAGWFLHVAEHGYDSEQSTAFFPLYPLAVRAVAAVTGSTAVAGVLLSLAAAGLAAVALARLARPLLGERGASDTVLLLALWPVAFVFTALYSEGLFLALAAGAFLAAVRRRPWLAAGLAALAVATRPVGLALLPALALLLWPRGPLRLAPLALVPLPLVAFGLFLERRFGSWRVTLDAQREFWQREQPALGPAGGLWESARAAWDGTAQLLLHLPRTGETFDRFDQLAVWYVLHFLLLAAAVWLTWVAWRRLGPAYGLYSAAFLAIVLASPSDWFPLMSLPRFLLGDFPLVLALAAVLEGRPRARTAVLVAFAAAGGAAAVAFSRGIWVA